jgi:hypothetical protein
MDLDEIAGQVQGPTVDFTLRETTFHDTQQRNTTGNHAMLLDHINFVFQLGIELMRLFCNIVLSPSH